MESDVYDDGVWSIVSVENRIVSIVDDDPEIVLLFHEALKALSGITIFTFTDPILALEHFQVNEYAYVLVAGNIRFQNAWFEWDGISEKDKGIE